MYAQRSNTLKGLAPKPMEDGTFFGLILKKADIDSISKELDKVDLKAIQTTCPEEDSGSAFSELIPLTVLKVFTLHTETWKEMSESTVSPYMININRKILNMKRRKLKRKLKIIRQVYPDSPKLKDI